MPLLSCIALMASKSVGWYDLIRVSSLIKCSSWARALVVLGSYLVPDLPENRWLRLCLILYWVIGLSLMCPSSESLGAESAHQTLWASGDRCRCTEDSCANSRIVCCPHRSEEHTSELQSLRH